MGNNSSSEEEEQQNIKNDEEKNENIKPPNEPLRTLSNKYPIKENQPMILADGIYYNKESILGKKHRRQENSNILNNKDENAKKKKIEKIDSEKNKEELDDELKVNGEKNEEEKKIGEKYIKNFLENRNLKLKREKSAELNFIDHKEFKKLKAEPSSRIKYSNVSSLSFCNKFDNKKIKADNSINFSIEKINKNKNEKEEKNIMENNSLNNSLNSFMIISNNENNKVKEKINNNLIKEDIIQEEEFSYECLTKELYVKGIQGVDHLSIDIKIQNNGKDWPKDNIFLKNDIEKSQIGADEIKIISLLSGWHTTERIVFKYLNKVKPGIYYSYINLSINGKNYGKPIIIKVEILENEEDKKLNNLIKQMRNEFQLPDKDIKDEDLKNALIKNNFNITNAFLSLFVAD